MKRIYLVRHGISEANENKTILLSKPDHAIGLSTTGHKQAEINGKAFKEYLTEHGRGYPNIRMRMWVSPYKRTRQTAQGFLKALGDGDETKAVCDVREHVLLCEQQFGLFDGIPEEDLWKRYPEEHAHYKKCEDFEGRFWARMPLGESRFDVVQRVHQSFGTFHRDAERHGIEDIIIVAHGVTIRAFIMMWCHKTFEWFEKEPNPKNCSVRLIGEDGEDHGYIVKGL